MGLLLTLEQSFIIWNVLLGFPSPEIPFSVKTTSEACLTAPPPRRVNPRVILELWHIFPRFLAFANCCH